MSIQVNYCCWLLLLLLPAICKSAPYTTEGISGSLDLSVSREENIGRAWLSRDVLNDTLSSIQVGVAYSQYTSQGSLFVASAYAGYTNYKKFSDLDTLSLSLGLNYLFQLKHDYSALNYEVSANVTRLKFEQSDDREGELLALSFSASKRFGLNLMSQMTYEYQRRFAGHKTFETKNQSLTLTTEYRLLKTTTLYLDIQGHQGDLVTSAFGPGNSPPSASLAEQRVLDPVFSNCPTNCDNWAYRFTGDSYTLTAGVVVDIVTNVSVDLSVKRYDWQADAGIGYRDDAAMLGLVWKL